MSTVASPPTERSADYRVAEGWQRSAVLIVDDEEGMRNFLAKTLKPRCGQVMVAESAEAADALTRAHRFDLVILDITLPGKNGITWLRELREQGYTGEVVLITAFADLETAIEALRAGASDFILKPFRVSQILNAVKHSLERSHLKRENWVLRRTLRQRVLPLDALVGESSTMQALRAALQRAAGVASTVLLTGESGTGKELAARALHNDSPRERAPFVPVSCATMSPERIETALFGHAKGAFSGASKSRDGLFYYAQGGTLFLDEVAELPLPLQAALLRVLDDRLIRPVGSEQQISVDVRIVAATNRNLAEEVAAGRFRKDFYYRLQVVEIGLPPLREHKADIPELAAHFIRTLAPQLGVETISLSDTEMAYLCQYDWPGNVRELRNLIERSPTTDLHTLEKRHILSVLDSVSGDKTRAAQLLGISRRTLERRCVEWAIG
jgi:DNA-binding NtrC family response regulator